MVIKLRRGLTVFVGLCVFLSMFALAMRVDAQGEQIIQKPDGCEIRIISGYHMYEYCNGSLVNAAAAANEYGAGSPHGLVIIHPGSNIATVLHVDPVTRVAVPTFIPKDDPSLGIVSQAEAYALRGEDTLSFYETGTGMGPSGPAGGYTITIINYDRDERMRVFDPSLYGQVVGAFTYEKDGYSVNVFYMDEDGDFVADFMVEVPSNPEPEPAKPDLILKAPAECQVDNLADYPGIPVFSNGRCWLSVADKLLYVSTPKEGYQLFGDPTCFVVAELLPFEAGPGYGKLAGTQYTCSDGRTVTDD
jgi:hypothetical protein